MKIFTRSTDALNRRNLLLLGILLSVGFIGFIGWAAIHETAPQSAKLADDDSEMGQSESGMRREADDPEGRTNWFMYQRMYPFKEVPEGARRRAWNVVRSRAEGIGPEVGETTWTSIGATPTAGAGPGGSVSGRINEIAISPANNQIILVAGSTGGIWRSTNGGTTFFPVSDSQVDVAVGAIAFSPSDANIVYAGMGDTDNGYFGTGVLKSTDAGATWTRVSNNSLPDKGQSARIRVDAANPNKVYLALFNSLDTANCNSRPCSGVIGGVYVSTNGGVSWTKTLTGRASDLAIHPTNPQIIYAGLRFGATAGDPRGLFKSTDGGTTWNNVLASPYTASSGATKDFRLAVTAAAPDNVYVYFGTEGPPPQVRLEMSTDAGATFTNRGVVTNTAAGLDQGQFGYNTYLEVSPTDSNTVYVGCRDIFKSTDGGVTFTNINNSFQPPYPNGAFTESQQKIHTDQQALAFLPGSATTFYAGNDGGIFKTTDSGATFTSLNATLSLVQFVSLALHPTDVTRSYGGAQDNGSQRRTVGTTGWVEFVGGDGGKIAINPLDTSMVFPSNTEGSISRVLNNGTGTTASIAAATSFGEPSSGPRIEFYPPVVTNGVDAKVYSGSWRLFICSDCNDPAKEQGTANSTTWTAPGGTTDLTTGGNDVITSIAVAKSDINVIYTGSRDGKAMRSTNGGANWTDITTGLPTRNITNITVSVTDPTLVYLTVSGYGSGHVFKSTNSGTAWTNISNNLPDIPTSAFLIDPLTATTLYAGTDIGVFRSTDSGALWAAFNTGLPPAPVMAFSSQATGKIQLSTYGRGAYELTAGAPASGVSVNNASAQERPARHGEFSPESDPVVFTISLSAPSAQPITVRVSTNGISATEGEDFMAVDDLDVVFPPNTMTQTVSVPLIEDPGDEPDETFSLDITNVVNATVDDGEGIGTIIDDDPSASTTVQFNAATYFNDEAKLGIITISRTGDTTGTSTVTASTSNATATGGAACTAGVDYVSVAQLVTFGPGVLSQIVNVTLCKDANLESQETVHLALLNPSAGTGIGSLSSAVLTINDTASQFTNLADITVFPGGISNPYPSSINVVGGPPIVGSMRVTLFGVRLDQPANLDFLLVGPSGRQYILMADTGGPLAMTTPATLTFVDSATQVLPCGSGLATGQFRPTNCTPNQAPFLTPAPAPNPGPFYNEPGTGTGVRAANQRLNGVFGGGPGNGTWSLYVKDDAGSLFVVTGNIAGWGIQFFNPTAVNNASITGRITTAEGQGIRNARVTISGDSLPEPRVVQTGSFGYFSFEGLQAGGTYVVTVNAKRYAFSVPSRVVTLSDSLTDYDFVADP